MTLEELTKEELIAWIRENVPKLNEVDILKTFLQKRHDEASKKASAHLKRCIEITEKSNALVFKYHPNAKAGETVFVSARVAREVNAMRKEAHEAFAEHTRWSDISSEAFWKLMKIYELELANKGA